MYLVAGVTGNTGRETAQALLDRGKRITVLVREEAKGAPWKAKGAAVAVGSLDDEASLGPALERVDGAFLLMPPNYMEPDFLADRARLSDAIASAVAKSGVPHVVLLSSMGAQHAGGTGLIRIAPYGERAIAAGAKSIVSLRPGSFVENWSIGLARAKDTGVLQDFFTPGRAIPQNATRDVGRIAADLLIEGPAGKRVVEMSGPVDLSPEDIARAATEVFGRTVTYQAGPVDAAIFASFGFPPSVAALFAEMYNGINSGYVDFEHSGEFRRGTIGAVEAVRLALA